MNKKTFFTEISYILGMMFIAIGTALMEKADLGMSMVVAPAYVLQLKLVEYFPFLTFGTMVYIFEGFIIILLMLLMRKFRISYFFSFVTAVIYGVMVDGVIFVFSPLQADTMFIRIAAYIIGMVSCSVGVSLLFHTYFSPEAYELFVKEIAGKFGFDVYKTKTCYDCVSCLVGIVLSFIFFGFGHFEGVKLGTIICALVNGWLIGRSAKVFEHYFQFKDGLKLRKFFDK